MRTFGSGKETYLFLNGLKTDREIRLSDSIALLPANPDCHTDLFLGLGKSDLDISVISLFLPLVQSQLRVRGADARDTATRAWNAVWDALLLGAITDSEVICNLQSDLPVERLKPDSRVSVTNYYLRGLSSQPVCLVSDPMTTWIDEHFAKARSLLDEESFQNAVHCLASFRWHSMPGPQLAVLWSGIEGLFGVDSEIVFRISLYVSRLLAPEDRIKQIEVFRKVKALYKVRSKAVHGGRVKGNPENAVQESAELLRSLVLKCAEAGAIPVIESLVP